MDNTITLDETIEVKRPLDEVFAYVSEFNRIDEWDPGVARGTKLSEGSTGTGTRFRIDMKAGFSLHYTMIGFEPATSWPAALRMRSRWAPSACRCGPGGRSPWPSAASPRRP